MGRRTPFTFQSLISALQPTHLHAALRRPFSLLLISYILLAVIYNLVTPIGESDNELSHYRYIQYVHDHRRLPPVDYVWPSPPRARCSLPAANPEHQFRQPPLYYVINALAFAWLDMSDPYWPDANPYGWHALNMDGGRNAFLHTEAERFPYHGAALAVHLIRFFSTLIGLLGLLAVARAGHLLFPREPRMALLMPAVVAFNPAYIFASAVINNDILVATLGLWAVYFALRGLLTDHSATSVAGMALTFGLALITKYTAVLLTPFLLLALTGVLVRAARGRERRRLVRWLPFVLLAAVPVVWWFWRNLTLYGELLPGYRTTIEALGHRFRALRRLSWTEQARMVTEGIRFTFITYWGLLGADALLLPDPLLNALEGMCALIGLGLIWRLITRQGDTRQRWLVLLSLVGIVLAWSVGFISVLYAPRGRYLLTLYGLFAFLLVWGGSALRLPHRAWTLADVLAVAMVGIALYAALGVIRPTFLPPDTHQSPTLAPEEMPLHARVDDLAELVGMDVRPRDVAPGDTLNVTLRWRVLNTTENNYVVGVHLTSTGGTDLGGTAHWPANGRYATSLWQPGDVFLDTYTFRVKEDANIELPTAARVLVSVYCQGEEGDRGLTMYDPQGNAIGTFVLSAPIRLGPREPQGEEPHSLLATFGEEIGLLAVEGVPESPHQGAPATHIRMTWVALAHPSQDYSVFVQVLDEENRVRISADLPLTNGRFPSSLWRPGDRVVHDHHIDLSALRRLPPGTYRLVMGLYHLETGERLPVRGNDIDLTDAYRLAVWHVPRWQRNFLPFVQIAEGKGK